MTANPTLASLCEEQKNLVYNVREIYPALDTTDCVNLCKSCNWNRDVVNSTLAESNSSFGDSKWKEIDRKSSKRKKKEGEKANFSDGFTYNVGKKKKAFNRRQRRGKNFDRKGRGGKPTKDRKSNKGDWKKRGGENSDQSRAKHLIQRTNAVTNTSAGSWAAKARAPPRPESRPSSSPQRDPSSKSENSRKENEVSNSSSDIGPPPGIITTSVWTEVNHTEPEVNHTEQYPDFFDSEQFNTQSHLVEPETKNIYPGDNLSSFQDTQIYPGTKFSEPAVKPDLTAFQIDHDRRSSTSQYSRPIENIESIGVDIRIGTEGPPDYNIPVEPFHSEHGPHQYQFGEIVNSGTNDNVDGRSRPVSNNSSAVGGTPFHSIHSSAKDNRVDHSRAVQTSKGGVTMPPANSMMFPNSSQQDRFSLSMFGSLVLPPEQQQLKTGGTAVYHFGVDFSEERKMESNELYHPPPNHFPVHVLGDPTQQVLQRPGRMDYADRPPYQLGYSETQPPPRAVEISHDMNRSVNMNRNSHDLNLHSHPVDTHFSIGGFEDIGPSIMDSTRDPHGRPQHLGHQRLESHFEERKSNHIEIDDSRNQNRINNIQPMHMAAPRPFSRPDNIRSVPAEITEPFFNEAKRMEPSHTRGFDEPQPDFQNHHTPYVPNPPQAFKPKPNTGFKDVAGYVQPAPYGVEQLQNLEGDKTGPSSTPPLVNANTEYKQHHFYGTNQITYYPHVPQAYTTAPVPTYQPQYTTAPRTNVYSYSAAQVMSTNPVYPSYSQPVLPSYSMT